MLLTGGTASGAKESQAEWFASDLTIPTGKSGTLKIHVAITSAVALSYTIDGTNFVTLNAGSALVADTGYIFTLPVVGSSTFAFNMKKATSGNVTVTLCEVHLI